MKRHYFALFDSLRGLAVLGILTFHVASLTGRLGEGAIGRAAQVLGGQSVTLFFVISGFLLYRPFVAARVEGRPAPDLRRFLKRRAFRILPGYWVILTLLAIFPGVVGAFSGDFWRYYGFLQLYEEETIGRGLPIAWTLCVEVTFYLFLPVWALLMRRARPAADLAGLAAVSAVGVALQVAASRQEVTRTLADSLPGQMPWLGLGMALAIASVIRPMALGARRGELCWAGAAVAFAAMTALVPSGGLGGLVAALTTVQPLDEAVGRIALTYVFVGLLVLPAVFGEDQGGIARRILAWRPVAWIGMVSFSLYLWHLTVAQFLQLDSDPAHFSADGLGLGVGTAALWALTVAISAALAAVSFRYVELPFIRRAGSATRALPEVRRY